MTPDVGPLPEPYLSATATALALGENVRQPLYTAAQLQAERERCYALGVSAERARIIAELRERHEADKHRHNYWQCLARELEGG